MVKKLEYNYPESIVREFCEYDHTLTDLEALLLDEIEEVNRRYEDLLESVPVVHTIQQR